MERIGVIAIRFIDFFSGIGGIRLGLEQAGHHCVGYCEFDKFARKSYEAMYDTSNEWMSTDVTTVKNEELPKADLWCFGFPCQDLSMAGLRKGIENGERSKLFFEIIRLLEGCKEEDKPKWLLAENVKGLLSAGNGFDFARCLYTLGQAGYDVEWCVLNSKDYGVPQHRERVFLVGCLRTRGAEQVFFNAGANKANNITIKQVGGMDTPTRKNCNRDRVYDAEGIAPCLNCCGGGGIVPIVYWKKPKAQWVKENRQYVGALKTQSDLCGQPLLQIIGNYMPSRHSAGNVYDTKGISPTVMCNHNTVTAIRDNKGYLRRLTPREYWRLQGFPDSYFNKVKDAGVSDTQLYKQAGNAVTVTVAHYIGKRFRELE